MADFGLRGIDLTDAQREQIRSIMDAHKTEFDATGAKLRDAHRAFADATIEAATVDESAVRTAATAVGAAMAEEAILRGKVRTEVQAILTPEQQEQLKQMETRRQQLQPRRRGQ
jgi:protein CpxP